MPKIDHSPIHVFNNNTSIFRRNLQLACSGSLRNNVPNRPIDHFQPFSSWLTICQPLSLSLSQSVSPRYWPLDHWHPLLPMIGHIIIGRFSIFSNQSTGNTYIYLLHTGIYWFSCFLSLLRFQKIKCEDRQPEINFRSQSLPHLLRHFPYPVFSLTLFHFTQESRINTLEDLLKNTHKQTPPLMTLIRDIRVTLNGPILWMVAYYIGPGLFHTQFNHSPPTTTKWSANSILFFSCSYSTFISPLPLLLRFTASTIPLLLAIIHTSYHFHRI